MIDAPFVEAAKSERSTGTGTGFDRQVAVDVIEVQPPLGGGALEDGFGQPRVEERRYQLRPKDVSITEGTGRLRTHDPDRNEPLEPVLRNPAAISSAAAPRKDASRSGVCADGVGADRRRDETPQAVRPSLPRGCGSFNPSALWGPLTGLSPAAAEQVLVRPPLPKAADTPRPDSPRRRFPGEASTRSLVGPLPPHELACHPGGNEHSRAKCVPTSSTMKPVPGRPPRPFAPDPSHGNEPRRESLSHLARPDARPNQAPRQPRGERKHEQHGPRRRQ
jgi:hypothetical protein